MRACTLPFALVCFLFAIPCAATEDRLLQFSFDDVSPESLQGQASVAPIGPTGESFEGLPDKNLALQLDGKGDYVRILDNGDFGSLDFRQDDEITIEAWVRLDRIGNGQNVYIIGKGRTFRDGPKDNQNYALRLRSVSRDARLSFLFRSAGDDETKPDWHRWTSSTGFRPDGFWHHVAVSYKFGDPGSICGYLDGKKVGGKWDMGGATKQPPVVDDDEVWIGSSMGGSAGNSFTGSIDEVIVYRALVPAKEFADRRVVITHPPVRPADLAPNVVNICLYEDVSSEGTWPMKLPKPLLKFEQPAFLLSRMPTAYGDGGVRRDWSGPVMMTATAEIDLPVGSKSKVEWMLRAGGLSRLWIDDEVVVDTPVHLGSTSGHGKVIPNTQKDPWLRPLHPGHAESIASADGHDGPVLVTLQTMIGGSGLRSEAGEILVAYRTDPNQQWHVLGFDEAIALTDFDLQRALDSHDAVVQSVDDQQRRLAASVEDEYWDMRHEAAKKYVSQLPNLEIPESVEGNLGPVDRFIDNRLSETKGLQERTPLTTDGQFLRRLYLDCLGVVPASVENGLSRTREQWIDFVLQDERWADHWTSYWMDVLAENPNVLKPSLNNTGPFRFYLHDMMRDNVRVDRWVTGLLRMEGSSLGGGPAGFAMAAQNDVPMAAKAHVAASAFLSANMKCARCHDAPYHDWTQRDLFSIAAMLARKPIKVPDTSSVPKEFFESESEGESLIELSLSPGEQVAGRWSLASYTTEQPSEVDQIVRQDDSREEAAYQITRYENQQFAKTMVNRLWKQLMGEAIVEPVDDWEGANPSHPELLNFLARELVANEYDIKHVARLILTSQAYQRQSQHRKVVRDETERLFASPRARRMTAEQLVDSLHEVVGRPMNCDELTFDPEARMKSSAHNNLGKPKRAWQLTSLSNERDRPALSLPRAAAVTECLEAFGWKGARQEPINHRQYDPNVIQPGILAGGSLSTQLTRVIDGDELTSLAIAAESAESLVDQMFQRFLTREPTDLEREKFSALVTPGFPNRVRKTPAPAETPIREPSVSWANHLHPDATDVRLREAARLRQGPEPSRWLEADWRERFEDSIWALINTPEFVYIP